MENTPCLAGRWGKGGMVTKGSLWRVLGPVAATGPAAIVKTHRTVPRKGCVYLQHKSHESDENNFSQVSHKDKDDKYFESTWHNEGLVYVPNI